MRFTQTQLEGAWLIEPDLVEDERGLFARTFCRREFSDHGLAMDLVQCSFSDNRRRGTLRGLHYQAEPFAEVKLVRCTRGAIHDVIVDLRPESPTFRRWVAFELTARNFRMLYVSHGMAHGFQTLEDDSQVSYRMSEFYHPEASRGVRWDDPAFAIEWPLEAPILSSRDRSFALCS